MQGVLVYRLPRRHPDHLFKDTKPDGTNLIKLVEDALNPMCIGGYEVFQGAYTDDARIVYETWAKMWATPRIPRGIYVILREVSADQEEELSEWVYKTFVSPWRR
jgi:Holliday junction resolvase RusA-like endonuclease